MSFRILPDLLHYKKELQSDNENLKGIEASKNPI